MKKLSQNTLAKANETLLRYGKQISVKPNGDKSYAIYVNGMLIYWKVSEERLFLNIMVVFLSNVPSI